MSPGTTVPFPDPRITHARRPPRPALLRLGHAVLFQRRRTLRCPELPVGEGTVALVTGGNRGIGAAVADRLDAAGADVVVAARGVRVGEGREVAAIAGHPLGLKIDLGDLDDVRAAEEALRRWLGPRRLDLVILNAGLIPQRASVSAQGFERAFAVNVLGHHVLLERIVRAGTIAEGARVVVVTGDIQVLARDCTPIFEAPACGARMAAYARSKLGLLWLATEAARRHPALQVVAVHPGVVDSGLGRDHRPRLAGLRRLTRIPPELSAETVLLAATEHGLRSGAYLHNTLGWLDLHSERAGNEVRARSFVDRLDELAAPWVHS